MSGMDDALRERAERAEARAEALREQLDAAVGGLIFELETREKTEGKPTWERELVADGHFRVWEIREFRDFLARDDALRAAGPGGRGREGD
jgi:hypothetical protein